MSHLARANQRHGESSQNLPVAQSHHNYATSTPQRSAGSRPQRSVLKAYFTFTNLKPFPIALQHNILASAYRAVRLCLGSSPAPRRGRSGAIRWKDPEPSAERLCNAAWEGAAFATPHQNCCDAAKAVL